MPKKNTASASTTEKAEETVHTDEISFNLSQAPIYGTGLKAVRQGSLLILVVDLEHEGYITQGREKKMADGSIKISGGGNIMHGTSHGVSKMVNGEGKEVSVNVNVYSKAPQV